MTLSRVLALDSAFGTVSVAAGSVDSVFVLVVEAPDARAAEDLPRLTQLVLAQSGWTISSIDRFAVTLGPGGFTSLRSGLAFAKGLAFAAKKPLLGFTTLEALALSAAPLAPGLPIVSALDAKRDELFVQIFDARFKPLTPPSAVKIAEVDHWYDWVSLGPVALGGSGAEILLSNAPRLSSSHPSVAALNVTDFAIRALNVPVEAYPADAVYLRPADARPMA